MNILLLLGLGLAAYLVSKPKSASNIVTIVMQSPAALAGDAAVHEMLLAFGIPTTALSVLDDTPPLASPSPGVLTLTFGVPGGVPKLPAVGQTFTIRGVPVKISSVQVAPARVYPST